MCILLQTPKLKKENLLTQCELYLSNSFPNHKIYHVVNENNTFNNIDYFTRKWWRENKHIVEDDIIYIITYDAMPESLPEPTDFDLASINLYKENIEIRDKWIVKTMKNDWQVDNWMWWPQVKLMSHLLGNKPASAFIDSKGFYIIKKTVLNNIADSKYDDIFSKSMHNSLRLPTIAELCGAKLKEVEVNFFGRAGINRIRNGTINEKQNTAAFKNTSFTQEKEEVSGVGTELSKILETFGIKAGPNCKCKQRAKLMNKNGIEWCENNISTIVEWLEEEAKNRKLIFSKTIAKIVINRAIRNAKRLKNDNSPVVELEKT